MNKGRRLFFRLAFAFAVSIATISLFLRMPAATGAEKASLKIGIIGSGNIGGTLGEFWIKAGHEVLFSSRHPEELKGLVERLGPKAHAGTTREAVNFGESRLLEVDLRTARFESASFQNADLSGAILSRTNSCSFFSRRRAVRT